MVAAMKGYILKLIMPENMSLERRQSMQAFGAELILVSVDEGMEFARDLALQMQNEGKGKVLDQFANPDNPLAHYKTTGPEIWRDTDKKITHFVSSMGTTGTIMGTSRYLKEVNPDIKIVGVEPSEGSKIPGIRKWQKEYVPSIFNDKNIDQVIQVTQEEAEVMMRRMGKEEGIFCGVSSGGAMAAALKLSEQVENALIVSIVCDRGDRYLSTGLFSK